MQQELEMDHSTEKTELRELTELEIENVTGGAILPVLIVLAVFVMGMATGATIATK